MGIETFFFFNDTATTEIYTLSLHDALPICFAAATSSRAIASPRGVRSTRTTRRSRPSWPRWTSPSRTMRRSEEHTSELQSRQYLVCRLLLEKKNNEPMVITGHEPYACLLSV